MNILCIKDVVMRDESGIETGVVAFTAGQFYKGRKADHLDYSENPYEPKLSKRITAKNNQKSKHYIANLSDISDNKFFYEHFTIVL